jgi:acyl carrier protein
MTKQEFYSNLEQVLEADSGTIKGQEVLKDLPAWGSMAVISFIAMVDSTMGISISARDIMGCKTVNDLMSLCGDKISG